MFQSLIWKLRLSLLGESVPKTPIEVEAHPDYPQPTMLIGGRAANIDTESTPMLSLPIPSHKHWSDFPMGPFLMGRLDLAMRSHFRSQGHGFFKINRLMQGFSSNLVDMASAEADIEKPGVASQFEDLCSIEAKIGTMPATQGEPGSTGALGDGTLLQQLVAAFKAFATSDFGKALIAAIEKALLGFLIP